MVTLLPPEFVRVTVLAALWPTPTFPNDKEDGVSVNVPRVTAWPDTATPRAIYRALVMDSRAEGVPATCGVNVTVNVAPWRGASVKGNVRPLTTNWGSDDVTLEMVTDLREVLLTLSVICFELPMTAVPKFKLVLLTTRAPSLR